VKKSNMMDLIKNHTISKTTRLVIALIVLTVALLGWYSNISAQTETRTGSVGLEGKISTPPPKQSPTITRPANGAVFTQLPITVTGMCPNGLLVKIFKNNVFSGSVMCENGSYNIQIDLFSSTNDLIARAYDSLDQASPDSNKVTVIFNDDAARANVGSRVSLTTNYARRGANPKELLTWPLIISGGIAPYAVSVDWGDGTTNDLYTVVSPGEFNIKHTYESSGSFRALIKATDKSGATAYLQVVAISNGRADQTVAGASASKEIGSGKTIIMWQPAAIAVPLIISTFWLGKKYEVSRIKKKLQRGEHPFK